MTDSSNARLIRRSLVLCSILHGLNHYLLIFFKPMYPLMADYFGIDSVAAITTRLTIAYLGYGLANFITGAVARRVSLRLVLFLGMIVMSLSAAAMAFVPADAYGWAVALAFLMGLGGGTYHPAANTLMTSLHEGRPGHAIGILSIGSAIGFTAAPLIGTLAGRDLIGFQNLFLLSGGASFVYAWLFLLGTRGLPGLPSPEPPLTRDGRPAGRHAIGVLLVLLLAVPAVLRDVVNWGYYEITPYWVRHGFSQGIGVEWIQLMAYLPGLLVQPVTGKLCDRFRPVTVVTVAFLLTAAGHALLAVDALPAVWVGLGLYGIGLSAATVANETYLASVVSVRYRALIYGIVLSLALGLGGYLGGASGWIIDAFGKGNRSGYLVWFVGMAVLTVLSLFAYLAIERIRRMGKLDSLNGT